MTPEISQLIAKICAEYHVTVKNVMSRDRHLTVARARHAIFAALRKAPYNFSTPEIGRIMGRDHTSVLSGSRRYEQRNEVTT